MGNCLDNENILNISKIILYILNFHLKEYNLTTIEVKYYLFLINEKYKSLFKEELFECEYSQDDVINHFDYYIQTLKVLNCIEVSEGFVECIKPLKIIEKKDYTQQERITMDIILKEYQNIPPSVFHKMITLELKLVLEKNNLNQNKFNDIL